jgi:hypothetical protein
MWTVIVSDSPAAVPTDGGAGSASVSNTRKLGSLEVTKTVNWNGVTPDEGQTFEICITGPSHITPDCKTADNDGSVLTWSNLIPGNYTVTETDPGTMWTVVVSDSPAAVPPDGGTGYASVSNTHKLGILEVTKTVNWNGVTPEGGQTFEICITGPSHTTPNCQAIGYEGGTLTWSNLTHGNYTVAETDPGTMWTVVVSGSPAVVPPSGGTVSASVSNTRKLGGLEVTKTVNWNGITPDEGQTFEICITGPSHITPDCKIADYDGEVLTWSNLLPGNYSVTETDPGPMWTVVVGDSPAAVPTDGGTGYASVSNTRKLGGLEVTKSVNWNGVVEDSNQIFEICISGPSYTIPDCKTTGYGGGMLVWNELLPGEYTVAETNPGDKWIIEITGSPGNVPADGGQANVSVSNTLRAIPLVSGWNLISIPLEPADPAPAEVLNSISGYYDQVFAYEGCTPEDPWLKYIPGGPDPFNTLTSMDVRHGYWINITSPVTMSVSGSLPFSTSMDLCTGWNLIGYASWTERPITEVLAGIDGKYSLVFAYDASDSSDPWKKYDPNAPPPTNDLDNMKPWSGYWINMTESTTLIISGP